MSEKKWDKSLYNRKDLVKEEPKEERILEVEGYGLKMVHKCFFDKFYSNLEQDDVENLPEEEQKIYWTLKDLISP